MRLFGSGLLPPTVVSDDAVDRYVAALRADLDPDPLFRRRLRGRVMNEYVARRDQIPAHRAPMGRLGRAVLSASVTLMLGVSTTMAASQAAIPGDALYPIKRQIEQLRLQALPADVHDELVAYALAERIEELDRLAELGRWEAVRAQAAATEAAYATLAASVDVGSSSVQRHLVVLDGLLDRLPRRAQEAVTGVMDRVNQARDRSSGVRRDGDAADPRPKTDRPTSGAAGGGQAIGPTPSARPAATERGVDAAGEAPGSPKPSAKVAATPQPGRAPEPDDRPVPPAPSAPGRPPASP